MPDQSPFQRLQKRSFGGEDVAARPGSEDDAWWPQAPLLPGISEAIEAFIAAADRPHGLSLVFLLGGAGNGKSFAARELAAKLGLPQEPADSLAKRSYGALRGNTKVEIVNDATIAPGETYGPNQSIALATDVARWHRDAAHRPVAAFCCVNRGVIIDELQALEGRSDEVGPLAAEVLRWLSSPSSDLPQRIGATETADPTFLSEQLRDLPHFRGLAVDIDGLSVWIAAVSVDASSLMDQAEPGKLSRAGHLFHQVVVRCRDVALERPAQCPIRANVLQWDDERACRSWEGVLAAGEIGSGRPHSFREVWGLCALSILGPRFVGTQDDADLLAYVDRKLGDSHEAVTPSGRLLPLLELSRLRAHEALFRAPFPAGDDHSPQYPPTTPPHAGLALVDPSTWGSNDSPILEAAMEALAVGQRPSERLQAAGQLPTAWSGFDDALEQALMGVLDGEKCADNSRRRLVSWYGGYLSRLMGVSNGRLGNAAVVQLWRHCHEVARLGPAPLPLSLDERIRILLYPGREGGPPHTIAIPAFSSRAEPLRWAGATSPRLAELVSHAAIAFSVVRSAGRLSLECVRTGSDEVLGHLVLDFMLLREALACQDGSPGQTESSGVVEPRIERCRAATLQAMPATSRRLIAVHGNSQVELST